MRKQYPIEVREYRRRRAQTRLIVMVDADKHAVTHRLSQLEQALKDEGIPQIKSREKIARLIPRRNVETWILCLNGIPVDEEKDYKNGRDWNTLIHEAGNVLEENTRNYLQATDSYIPSLQRGIRELRNMNS